MSGSISSVQELEACIGVAGAPVKMKIIDHLDAQAAAWIAASPIVFVGLGGPEGPRVRLAGGRAGFARVADAGRLIVPWDCVDEAGAVEAGQGAGVLFLVPGVGETLRANGRVGATGAHGLEIQVEECFVHCAKALIRSDFWAGGRRRRRRTPRAWSPARGSWPWRPWTLRAASTSVPRAIRPAC